MSPSSAPFTLYFKLLIAPKKVNQFSFSCRLDHLILDETSKENQKEESREEDFGQMPLGKTQAKYLYPEEKLSLLRKFNVVLDC